MAGYLENLNEFLVGLFNEILKIEGNALCSGEAQEISVRDMHIIEAICAGKSMRERQTTAVAQRLGVTTGTLTVAIKQPGEKGICGVSAGPHRPADGFAPFDGQSSAGSADP